MGGNLSDLGNIQVIYFVSTKKCMEIHTHGKNAANGCFWAMQNGGSRGSQPPDQSQWNR